MDAGYRHMSFCNGNCGGKCNPAFAPGNANPGDAKPIWVRQLEGALTQQVARPASLAGGHSLYDALHPYQKAAVDHGLRRDGRILLGHEMGLGKTLMALTLCAHYEALGEGPVLVVAPPVLLEQWAGEILQWVPGVTRSQVQVVHKGSDVISATARFVLTSFGLFTGTKSKTAQGGQTNAHLRETSDGRHYAILVVDECHALKSMSSGRTAALLPAMRRARRVVLMSGTPMANSCAADIEMMVDLISRRG
jgi:SWI/SNF-related matrix-associated actin-dependent regulator 1 of chromatin subfamily A